MSGKVETFEFQAEAQQLLELMIHSVYSNKDIFLRELISNSSDALDKRRFAAVQAPELLPEATELHILIETDKKNRTLSVSDNGIGMRRNEVKDLIGTIAKSGSREFLETLRQRRPTELLPEFIGQFGVGFYSSFMAAERIVLLTRRAGETAATRWESAGDGRYTLEEAERGEPGTTVTLSLKPADAEDGINDYLEEWTLRRLVKQYSDFVAYPIRMDIEHEEAERDSEGKPLEGAARKTVVRRETLNSMKAIWLRDKDEVSDEEYNEFYKHVSHDWNEPLTRIQAKIEGTLEYRLLLYMPSKAPFDLFSRRDPAHGLHLYVKRIFIMGNCRELLPAYLRFIRGVVDSEDLSLNISRELLQQDRQVQRMAKGIVNKVLTTLKDMREHDAEKYLVFWREFGRVFKEGLFEDRDNLGALLDLALFASTNDAEALTALNDYVARMKEGQDAIYYMTGESREQIEESPHLEAFREKNYEVLLLSDPVDEVWIQSVFEYAGKQLRSIGRGVVELGSEQERKTAEKTRKKKEEEYKSLLDCLAAKLSDHLKEVRLSSRLTRSAACLVTDAMDMSLQMEQMMKALGQDAPGVKRILELNPSHPVLGKLQAIFEANHDDPALDDYAQLLYGQALLAEGGHLPNPGRFSTLVADLMVKSL